MDPATAVGLAASVTEIALGLFFNLSKFYRTVRNAPAQSKSLREEIDSLVDLLVDLQEIFEQEPADQGQLPPLKEFENMYKLLYDLRVRTTPSQTNGVIRRLQWPFHQAETKEILSKIERFKGSLNTALSIRQQCPP